MKSIILAGALFMSTFLCSTAQSFEGTLVYKVDIEIDMSIFGDMDVPKEMIIEKLKKDGQYFDSYTMTFKNGNYRKDIGNENNGRQIYVASENKIYSLEDNFEYVMIDDAEKFNARNITEEPTVESMDTTITVMGKTCKAVKLSWGKSGEEIYFYDPNTAKIDPTLLSKHNFEYFNSVINKTQSLPLEIYKSMGKMAKVRMTLVEIKEGPVSDDVFKLPAMVEPEAGEAAMMKAVSGSDVMKLK